jgi:hypothetical protein
VNSVLVEVEACSFFRRIGGSCLNRFAVGNSFLSFICLLFAQLPLGETEAMLSIIDDYVEHNTKHKSYLMRALVKNFLLIMNACTLKYFCNV